MKLRIRLSAHSIAVFLLAILCVCFLSPAVMRTVGNAGFFGIAFLYLMIEINALANSDRTERNTMLLCVVYIGILFLYKFLGLSTASVSYHYNIVRFFLTFLCIVPIYKRLSRRQIHFLLFVCLGTLFITMAQNYLLKMSWGYRYSIQLYIREGEKTVINTQYTSAIMLISGAMFCAFLNGKTFARRIISLALAILCAYFNLVVTQRGIILFLSIFMYPALLLFNSKRDTKQVVNLTIITLLLLLLVSEYQTVLRGVASLIGSARLTSRIESMILVIERGSIEGTGGGSLAARLRLTGNSIRTFWGSFSNFLMGVGLRTDSNDLVGNHSQFFDEFARFGVLGGLLSSVTILRMLKATHVIAMTGRSEVLKNQLSVLLVIIVLRAFIGTIMDPSIGAALFITIPLTFRLIYDEGGIKP